MNKLKSIILATCIIAIFAVVINGCKKTGDLNEIKIDSNEQLASKKLISDYIQKNGIEKTVELNIRCRTFLSDLQGNEVSLEEQRSLNLTSICNGGSGGNVPDYVDLTQYGMSNNCGLGYLAKYVYKVSWENNVVAINPANPLNCTKGTIKVGIQGNNNAFTNVTTISSITDLGVDPNNPDNNIYCVQFTASALIPNSIINNPTAVLRFGARFATDCVDLTDYVASVALPPANVGLFFSPFVSPCSNNFKINVNSPGTDAYNKVSVFGYDPLSICNIPANERPSLQEVQFNIDNTGWQNFINTSCPAIFGYRNKSFVSQIDFAVMPNQMTVGTQTVKTRTRNWRYNSPQTNFPVPTLANACVTPFWSETPTFTYVIN